MVNRTLLSDSEPQSDFPFLDFDYQPPPDTQNLGFDDSNNAAASMVPFLPLQLTTSSQSFSFPQTQRDPISGSIKLDPPSAPSPSISGPSLDRALDQQRERQKRGAEEERKRRREELERKRNELLDQLLEIGSPKSTTTCASEEQELTAEHPAKDKGKERDDRHDQTLRVDLVKVANQDPPNPLVKSFLSKYTSKELLLGNPPGQVLPSPSAGPAQMANRSADTTAPAPAPGISGPKRKRSYDPSNFSSPWADPLAPPQKRTSTTSSPWWRLSAYDYDLSDLKREKQDQSMWTDVNRELRGAIADLGMIKEEFRRERETGSEAEATRVARDGGEVQYLKLQLQDILKRLDVTNEQIAHLSEQSSSTVVPETPQPSPPDPQISTHLSKLASSLHCIQSTQTTLAGSVSDLGTKLGALENRLNDMESAMDASLKRIAADQSTKLEQLLSEWRPELSTETRIQPCEHDVDRDSEKQKENEMKQWITGAMERWADVLEKRILTMYLNGVTPSPATAARMKTAVQHSEQRPRVMANSQDVSVSPSEEDVDRLFSAQPLSSDVWGEPFSSLNQDDMVMSSTPIRLVPPKKDFKKNLNRITLKQHAPPASVSDQSRPSAAASTKPLLDDLFDAQQDGRTASNTTTSTPGLQAVPNDSNTSDADAVAQVVMMGQIGYEPPAAAETDATTADLGQESSNAADTATVTKKKSHKKKGGASKGSRKQKRPAPKPIVAKPEPLDPVPPALSALASPVSLVMTAEPPPAANLRRAPPRGLRATATAAAAIAAVTVVSPTTKTIPCTDASGEDPKSTTACGTNTDADAPGTDVNGNASCGRYLRWGRVDLGVPSFVYKPRNAAVRALELLRGK
ncbi:hypothetical protein HK102_008935 [Quaeritorhiza haematococci]|nr:hypothetical protein HK102_008935 [Quaeritorhiza haematococci]